MSGTEMTPNEAAELSDSEVTEAMKLPAGKTCADCAHFKRSCEWLISCTPDRTVCDWHPSRFAAISQLKGVT